MDDKKLNKLIRYLHEQEAIGVAIAILRTFVDTELKEITKELSFLGLEPRTIASLNQQLTARRESMETCLKEDPSSYLCYLQVARDAHLLPYPKERAPEGP